MLSSLKSLGRRLAPANTVGTARTLATAVLKPSFAGSIVERTQQNIEQDKPHFRVGGRQSYFPKARIILMKPGARHTPYQAKFVVPKSFNKLDLRDYLYHVYGLRVLRVTTQISAGTVRYIGMWRTRSPQIKTMIVDMEQPFIWPSDESVENSQNISYLRENMRYMNAMRSRVGLDIRKPTGLFEGVFDLDPRYTKHLVEPFVPKRVGRKLANKKRKALAKSNQDKAIAEQILAEKQGDI